MSEERKSRLRKARFATDADIEIKGAYGPDDARGDATPPAQFPFTRGVQPTMYRGQFWTMRQYAGFADHALECYEKSKVNFPLILDDMLKDLSLYDLTRDNEKRLFRAKLAAKLVRYWLPHPDYSSRDLRDKIQDLF